MALSHCNLVGPFGLIVQGTLFFVCTLAMLYKRSIERPKRGFLIFTLDISKQAIAQMMIHFLNIAISKSSGGHECSWYLFISTFDTFFGLLVNWIMLKSVSWLAEKFNAKHLLSGNYFKDQPANDDAVADESSSRQKGIKIDYGIWSGQLLTWCTIVLMSKMLLYYFELQFAFMVTPIHAILTIFPTRLKILLVLVVIPAFLNCLMVWVQDNLLKKSTFSDEEREVLYSQFYENESMFDGDDTNSNENDLSRSMKERDPVKSGDLELTEHE